MASGITPDHWDSRAREQRAVARLLAMAAFWADSYLHAGMALEFALKYRIMRHAGVSVWPHRQEQPALYTHNLPKLAMRAGLTTLLAREAAHGAAHGIGWEIARDWRIEYRYDPQPFVPERASAMLYAVDEMGLLGWLLDG
jgi:hypothetical protein